MPLPYYKGNIMFANLCIFFGVLLLVGGFSLPFLLKRTFDKMESQMHKSDFPQIGSAFSAIAATWLAAASMAIGFLGLVISIILRITGVLV